MSGKRTKTGHFPYRKQNSIAEIVSTMESFLVAGMGFDLKVPPPNHSRCVSQSQIAPSAPWFGGFNCTIHDLRGGQTRFKSCLSVETKENSHLAVTVSLFGCGDGIWTSWPPGYEPDELPGCSTPRYLVTTLDYVYIIPQKTAFVNRFSKFLSIY